MFLPYEGFAYVLNKNGVKRHQLIENLVQQAILSTTRQDLYMNSPLILREMVHYSLEHHVINVTKNIGERLMNTKMKIRTDAITMPFSVFEVCFEKGLLVPGTQIQIPSCIVIAKIDAPTEKATVEFVKQIVDYGAREGIKIKEQFDGFNKDLLSISWSDKNGLLSHLDIDMAFSAGQTIDQVVDDLPVHKGTGAPGIQDNLVYKKTASIVLGVLCYLGTKNPDIKKYRFHDRPALGTIPPNATVIGSSFERMPPGWHLRQAHFRTLGDECFRRDKDGNARIIWVNGSEVGAGRAPAGWQVKQDVVEQNEHP